MTVIKTVQDTEKQYNEKSVPAFGRGRQIRRRILMAKKTSRSLSLRLSGQEYDQIERISDLTGQDKSKVVRKILFSEGKVVFLEGGGEIVSQLYQLNEKLDTYRNREKITALEMDGVRKELAKIAANLCDIALHLSDFSDEEYSSEEEESSNEHYEDG